MSDVDERQILQKYWAWLNVVMVQCLHPFVFQQYNSFFLHTVLNTTPAVSSLQRSKTLTKSFNMNINHLYKNTKTHKPRGQFQVCFYTVKKNMMGTLFCTTVWARNPYQNTIPLWWYSLLKRLRFQNETKQNMSNTVFAEDCVHHLYLNNMTSGNDSYI